MLNEFEMLKALPDDWNGFGAPAPSKAAIGNTELFVAALPETKAPLDKIWPDVDGICLKFGVTLVTIGDDDLCFSSTSPGGDYFSADIPFDAEAPIPASLLNFLPDRG